MVSKRDLEYALGVINTGGIESEYAAGKIARDLRNLEDRQSARQNIYDTQMSKYTDPYAAMTQREREKKILDQLYARAAGKAETTGEIEGRIARQQATRGFQRNVGPTGSQTNPLLASRAAQDLAQKTLAGSEMESAQRALQGRIGAQSEAIGALESVTGREQQIQDILRELKFGEQREKEALSSEMARNLIERSQRQIDDYNQKQAARRAETNQYIGSALGAASSLFGAAMMASDERTKKNIKDGKGSIDIILETVGPVEYEYKDEYKDNSNAGRGKHLGVIAQDIEKAGLDGIVMVDPLTGMKVIDTVKMIPLLLAAQSRLNEKIDEKQDKKSNKGGNKK